MNTESKLSPIQQHLLKMLKFTTSFLERHNLKYISTGGTVLGAIRHKGFIPWDDDVDIYLWREDYDRFIDMKDALRALGYDVVSIEKDKGYYLPFAKIVDTNTTVWELEQLPYVLGNYIDIFPLDKFDMSDKEIVLIQKRARKLFYKYQGTLCCDNVKNIPHYIAEHHFGNAYRVLRSCITGKDIQKHLGNYMNHIARYSHLDGNRCANIDTGVGCIFDVDWFEDPIKVPFEDTEIVVPREYDKYLTLLYGDWRTPPPVSQQVSHHQRVYLNLREGLTLEQVRQRIAQGERVVL